MWRSRGAKLIYIRENDIKRYGKEQAEKKERTEVKLQIHKTKRKVSERGTKLTRGLEERSEGDEARLERSDSGREVASFDK